MHITGTVNAGTGATADLYGTDEYGAIVYGRGPLFFETLRNKIGTMVFDEFMQDYAVTLSWKISTPATLKALAEKHCSCNLDTMFQEWVYP